MRKPRKDAIVNLGHGIFGEAYHKIYGCEDRVWKIE